MILDVVAMINSSLRFWLAIESPRCLHKQYE